MGLREELDEFVVRAGVRQYVQKLRGEGELLRRVMEATASHGNRPLVERVGIVLTGETPVCTRGKNRKYRGYNKGFGYCGRGSSCVCLTEQLSEKVAEVKRDRSPEQIERENRRRRATVRREYGVDSVSEVKVIRDKARATTMERHGVEEILSLKSVRETGMMEKYGVDNPRKVAALRRQAAETYRARTGFDHPMRNPEVVRQVMAGRDYPAMAEQVRTTKLKTSFEVLLRVLPEDIRPGFTQLDWHGTHRDHKWFTYPWVCSRCGNEFRRTMARIENMRCSSCTPPLYQSKAEFELGEFITSLGVAIRRSDKSLINPFELDIVCEEKKIAIEYCGLYWHSEGALGKGPRYHLTKLDLCAAKGYRLITVFEDEWLQKRKIVESRFRSIFGKSPPGVGARKMTIREIDRPLARGFLDRHHIQGSGSAGTVSLGAFHEDQLCAVMTFGGPRIALGRKEGPPELLRFSTDGRNHPGVASRLLKTYLREYKPSSLISYADRRWSVGNLYSTIGFRQTGFSNPSYAYMSDYKNREYRFRYRKSVLIKQFGADPSKTEWAIMQELGYDRIWDCGTIRYDWTA